MPFIAWLGHAAASPPDTAPLTERFAKPPAQTRILKIIHPWPDEAARQDELIRTLQAQGFGGVVCNVSFENYLESDLKWAAFKRAVTAAKQAGMTLWLYDEKGYPSANAGGLVLRDHPEWEARGLLATDVEVGAGPVTLPLPPGRLFLAAAFPVGEVRFKSPVGQQDPLHELPTPAPRLPAPSEARQAGPTGEGAPACADLPAAPSGTQAGASAGRRRAGEGDGVVHPGDSLAGPCVDLSTQVREGRVEWAAPEGRWRVLAITESTLYEGTHAEGNLWQKLPYPNLLEAAPTARFLELTHARYARELGPDLGRYFVATFTDEPSLMSLFLRRMPYRPLPWSATLTKEFRQRRGYALEPIVPDLVIEGGPHAPRHRYDYWRTVGELVAENFAGQIQTWCRRHGLRSGGHLLAEEGLTAHVALYGNFFACLRRLDAPGIDCLTSLPPEVPWHIARLAASAAELDGQPYVMCETSDHGQVYRPTGDTRPKRIVTEAEIRGTCNRLLVSGVNVFTSYYSFSGVTDEGLRRLNEWVGRCATLLTGGHQVAEVAVVYPIESVWTRFVPAPHWANASPAANRIEHLYRSALEGLFSARRDLTVIDSRTLVESRVAPGELVHNSLRWRVVVLPGLDTLPQAAWDRLDEFVRAGGTVIALGARPANSESDFPSPRVRAWGERVFGQGDAASPVTRTTIGCGAGCFFPAGTEALLPDVLDRLLDPEVAVSDPRAPLRVTHRRIEGHEVFFLINDSPSPWQGKVACRATGSAERWDPATGQRSAWPEGTNTSLSLEPYGATFLRFAGPPPMTEAKTPAPLPRLSFRDLPAVQPAVARGEFVRETLSTDADATQPGRPAWRAAARIVKSDVDTFLFVRFPFPEGLDLAEAELLEVESWAPQGQRTPTQLLVIVQEKDGGDFLASTPRSLSVAGYDRCFLPLNRLHLAGWSKDSDGVLDRRRIAEVRVGWGGYVGRENEPIEFSLRAPRAGTGVAADVSRR